MKKFKKLYKFSELSIEAQAYAVQDYIKGWEETHEKNDMEYSEAQNNCEDDFFLYDESGNYIGEEN